MTNFLRNPEIRRHLLLLILGCGVFIAGGFFLGSKPGILISVGCIFFFLFDLHAHATHLGFKFVMVFLGFQLGLYLLGTLFFLLFSGVRHASLKTFEAIESFECHYA